jgi:hypothetical protein
MNKIIDLEKYFIILITMQHFKKNCELIEIHNNHEFRINMELDVLFSPNPHTNPRICKKSYLYSAVFCDNFEAYLMLINHNDFNMKTTTNYTWLEHIIKRYNSYPILENTRYLDELLKKNITFNCNVIKYCMNLDTFCKLKNHIDLNSPIEVIKNTLYPEINDDIQLYIISELFMNKPQIFTKQFVDNNILSYCIHYNKITLLNILKEYNIDINTLYGIPSILISNDSLNYFIENKYIHSENLLDKKWFLHEQYDPISLLNRLEFIVDNFNSLNNFFELVYDPNYELFNLFIYSYILNYQYKNYYFALKNNKERLSKIFKFIIKINLYTNENVFEKINHLYTNEFEKMFLKNDLRYNNERKESAMVLFGSIISCGFKPQTDVYEKIVEKAFNKISTSQIKEIYKNL